MSNLHELGVIEKPINEYENEQLITLYELACQKLARMERRDEKFNQTRIRRAALKTEILKRMKDK